MAGSLLYFSSSRLIALLGRGAFFGLDVVGDGVRIGAAVGEYGSNCQQPAVDFIQLRVDLVHLRFGLLALLVVVLFQRLIVGTVLDAFWDAADFEVSLLSKER